MRLLNGNELDWVTGGLKATSSPGSFSPPASDESWWDQFFDWFQDEFLGGGGGGSSQNGGGGATLTPADAERACNDLGITGDLLGHLDLGDGGYSSAAAGAGGSLCNDTVHTTEQQNSDLNQLERNLESGHCDGATSTTCK